MKILCVCEGGNVRSVACAYLLKYMHCQDALAVSFAKNSPATILMLVEWADKIIVMQREMEAIVPFRHKPKVSVYDVGPDKWGNAFHPQLLEQVEMLIQQDTTWVKGAEDAIRHSTR